MNRREALDAAGACVLKDRNHQYGPPEDSFGITGEIWSIILRPLLKEGARISAAQVALCLDGLKTARLINNPSHEDSWVDKIGYGACGAEIATAMRPPIPPHPKETSGGGMDSAIQDMTERLREQARVSALPEKTFSRLADPQPK